jgi:hypothetical protein
MSAFSHLDDAVRWLAWRGEQRGDKATKVPYSAMTGREGRANDASTWSTRAEAEAFAPQIINGLGGGIGIVLGDLGDGFGLGGIDLDSCRHEDGAIDPWAIEVIQHFKSYTEISPSQTGGKIYFLYRTDDLARLRKAMGTTTGKQFKHGNGKDHPPAIEVYITNRYFAVTEQRLDEAPDDLRVVDLDDLLWLVQDAGPRFSGEGSSNTKSKGGGATIRVRLKPTIWAARCAAPVHRLRKCARRFAPIPKQRIGITRKETLGR